MAHMTTDDVHEYINGVCFKTGPPGKVGAETEWLVTDTAAPGATVAIERLAALLEGSGPPPAGSRVTFEPGGQIELSSPALPGPARAHEALAEDLEHLGKTLAQDGLGLVESALDPVRTPHRQLRLPRYEAMDRFFAKRRTYGGHTMMCATASLQVCLDSGADPADLGERWGFAHRLGPVLVAAFANSALWRGRPTGWKSTRWAIWAGMDADRTAPVLEPGSPADPADAWTAYALRASVMAVSETPGGGGSWLADPGITLAEWIAGHGPRPATPADLELHLSTLFPPVRPRGWWELRMIDALPLRWWPVPVAVAAALFDDPGARAAAEEAVERLCGGPAPDRRLWLRAARDGMADPALAACARRCLDAAVDALPRMGATRLARLVDDYADRHTRRGLSPADTRPSVPEPRPAHAGPAERHSRHGGGVR
ncbi:ergothioneine biosynthesis glutamate--cysteine ligase EgtA [Nocardiopsis changdeensis]|uniref:Glutamate--cysteine ligase EgtA n=1 Tax=Nocardiopsis changdeensis TaxID=2831969 RepID=A0ABX8BJL0_9ACTN|nr:MULTISPECIES: ergothioneine biosynthesis glutamate--cysteine ligase EgtA [Nocardiopsis]QUX21479.1 ergothioneine biosynthesis glutamate--cysteine ligase EgtA [Nocardiopsis changdeensis]QYX37413.1 ergothioneine biosynthesis glutamate--cysteine ligase EgtA [Nocardiopsis sp. MT53]